ncbi:MAG TPA: 6-carboxytetrahydropterin synthase [Acidobacteriota bacterium]|nr:6-carboxytetrahydropterin synthase [Acidobacteriota bacterium]
MYSLTVRRHAFIAHALKSEVFGPASGLHGITLIVDAEFQAPGLDESNTVIDVVKASRALKEALAEYHYRNLETIPALACEITTMEFLARRIHDRVAARVAGRFKGRLKIVARESPEAWASYEAEVPAGRPKARRA